jgi:hypothetical protein
MRTSQLRVTFLIVIAVLIGWFYLLSNSDAFASKRRQLDDVDFENLSMPVLHVVSHTQY